MSPRITDFCVSDPDYPESIGNRMLPHNASSLLLQMWYEAGSGLTESEIAISIEQRGGFGGVQWVPLAVQGSITIEDGLISFSLPTLPAEITASDTHNNYRLRFNIRFLSEIGTEEFLILFGRAQLPVHIASQDFYIYDPDRKEAASQEVAKLAASAKRLGVELVFTGQVQEFDLRVWVQGRYARDVVWEQRLRARRNESVSLIIDPLPAQLVPSDSVHAPNYYNVHAEVFADGYSAKFHRRFGITADIPVGMLTVTDALLSDRPGFEISGTQISYSDLWQRAVLSLQLKAAGYDPRSDGVPARVTARLENSVSGTVWVAGSEVIFDDVGVGYAFVDQTILPALEERGFHSLFITVNHNRRVTQVEHININCVTGFRPDRLLSVKRTVILNADGTEADQISMNSRGVRVYCRLYKSPGGPTITASLALLPRRGSVLNSRTRPYTRALAFRRLLTTGYGAEDCAIDFTFPKLLPELFAYNEVAVRLLTSHRLGANTYTKLQDIYDFPIAEGNQLARPHAGFFTARPPPVKPGVKPTIPPERLSGKHWCKKFPTSKSLSDLNEAFGKNVQKFISVLEEHGAKVRITATRRPMERAYLMHYAYRIAKGKIALGKVPKRSGVDIVWNHENAVACAEQMAEEYEIVYQPAFPSRHELGEAIDMTITSLPTSVTIVVDGKDKVFKFGSAAAAANPKLWAFAANYFSILKLPMDAPHWMMK